MTSQLKNAFIGGGIVAGAIVVVVALSLANSKSEGKPTQGESGPPGKPEPEATQTVELNERQAKEFNIQPVEERTFKIERYAVGNISFNEEMVVDVFPPVSGKILKLYARTGDDIPLGTPLYTIDSPDLVQAGSTLISAAGILELTTRSLKRARELHEVQGLSQKDLDQATSDEQAAQAAYRAARDAVRIFGKTDAEMDQIVKERKIDSSLVVKSPISGKVTARNAAPGVLAQPGNPPAPYTLSDVSTLWMLADVAENHFADLRLGLPITVTVKAYPGRTFQGRIVNIGATVDPATRRVTVRSEIADPKHELRAGMFATFTIEIAQVQSPAVPQNGIIHEGDRTISVWVTQDRRKMTRRSVKIGTQSEGYVQILEGLKPGELIATEAALFLGNALMDSSK
jgi:cobalt-zinc-cadmium efflux system membrane fusion protein